MTSAIRWAIRNSPSMNTLMIAVLSVGLASMLMLRRERFPAFEPDVVSITVPYPGASPTETEEGICLKVEEAIRAVPGIRKITSSAREGSGKVQAELDTDIDDPERVLNDVRGAIDRIPSFPELAEKPVVKLNVQLRPVLSVAVLAPAGADPLNDPAAEWQFRNLSEQIYEELLQLPAVTHVLGRQAKPYQIDIEISEATLRKYGLTHQDIGDAVRLGNIELPGGEIKTNKGDLLLRAAGKHVTGVEIAKIPVLTDADGTVLTVGDLGTVRDGFAEVDLHARVDGRPCMSLQVQMTGQQDMLKIREQAMQYVAQKQMPEGYTLKAWSDYSGQTRDRLDLLARSGVMGLILVFVVLGFFLDLRLAFWVALGIPISVFGTCAIMLTSDASLNTYSMFAFVMALGIVVDDAIVIAENVYAHRMRGKTRLQAAIDGTSEVAAAVTCSVLTTVIAFIPLAFVTGETGKWIAVIPLGLVSMLLISLVEALFILPCHLAHSRLPSGVDGVSPLQRFAQHTVNRFIERIYIPAFRWSLANSPIVVSGSVTALLITVGIYLGGFTPFVFTQSLNWEFVYTFVEYPLGTPGETVDAATRQLEAAFRKVEREELGSEGGSLTTGFYRGVGNVTQRDSMRGDVYAEFDRDRIFFEKSSQDIVRRWRDAAGEFPGAERVVFWGLTYTPGGRPIELSLLSSDIDQLEAVSQQIKTQLATYTGVVDIHDSRGPGKWELQLKLKPDAETLGVQLDDVAQTVRAAFFGEEVMRLQRGRHEVKLMVRYPPEERSSFHQLDEIHIRLPSGDEIPLSVLAEFKVKRGYSNIHRIDQQRAVTIEADVDVARGNAPNIIHDFREGFLKDLLRKHPNVKANWEGQQEETRRSFSSLMIGFALALFGMYALLTLEFRSYLQPMIILAVLPFGFVGAVFGHLMLDVPLTIFSLFGVVTLSGIVANDSIVLIDFINRRLAEGVPLDEALLESGRRRFRPVMLTSITTIAALLPILLERNTQAQVLIPMAVSISFGLMVATVWILFLVPAMYGIYARCVFGTDSVTP